MRVDRAHARNQRNGTICLRAVSARQANMPSARIALSTFGIEKFGIGVSRTLVAQACVQAVDARVAVVPLLC